MYGWLPSDLKHAEEINGIYEDLLSLNQQVSTLIAALQAVREALVTQDKINTMILEYLKRNNAYEEKTESIGTSVAEGVEERTN